MTARAAATAALLFLSMSPAALKAQLQGNDDRARLGNFLPPPPPPPLPPAGQQQQQPSQEGEHRRRPWRELLDALLDATAPRLLVADSMTDDPLTTSFGNDDLIEPADVIPAARSTAVATAPKAPPKR